LPLLSRSSLFPYTTLFRSLALSLLGPKYLVRIGKSAFPLLMPDRRCAMLPRHNLPARTRSRLLPSLLPITFHTPPFRRRGERWRRPFRSFRQRTCRREPTSSFPWQSRLPDSGGAAGGSLSERPRVSAWAVCGTAQQFRYKLPAGTCRLGRRTGHLSSATS